MDINDVSGTIVDSAMKVHTALGPGLLESAYEACLTHDLRKRGHHGEVKSVERPAPIHTAQSLTYLKRSQKRLGLLINFNSVHLKDGITRLASKLCVVMCGEVKR